jgi:hypothetical protein
MKKLFVATLIAFALSTPAIAFDINSIEGIPSDMKDMIAKQSGGRITNKQADQQGGLQGQQQVGQDGPQQQKGGRRARKELSVQERAMQQADQFMKGGDAGTVGQGIGSFR